MGHMPSRLGYQPTMGTELSGLEGALPTLKRGPSRRSGCLCAGGRPDRPGGGASFSHLSASIVLSRKRASEGLYPAIDLSQSNSNMATPRIIGERHYLLAQQIRKTLAHYEEAEGHDCHARNGAAHTGRPQRGARACRLEWFLTQPFFATEEFSGRRQGLAEGRVKPL